MMFDIFAIAIITFSLIYFAVSVLVTAGGKRLRSYFLPAELPNVSVIICARNEEAVLGRCLESILKLDYPHDKLEIVLVDDESEDATLSIFRDYAGRDDSIKVLSTAGEPDALPGKQRPLNLGIRESSGEIILVTDADIDVRPGWIKGHLSAYGKDTGIVGGITRITTESGRLFDYVQNCDLVTKLTIALGCSGLGFSLSIMGNNVSFRRDAWSQVVKKTGVKTSVIEDMALMNEIERQTEYKVSWITGKQGIVESTPEKDFTAFVSQRFRWVSGIKDLSSAGKILIGMELLMFAAVVSALVILPHTLMPLIVSVFAWIAGYGIILLSSPGSYWGDAVYIPAAIVFQVVYGFTLGWRVMFGKKSIDWKGRIYEKNR